MTTSIKMRQGDHLSTLSVDDTELSYKEKNMLDMLYPKEPSLPSSPNGSPNGSPSGSPNVPIVIPHEDKFKQALKDAPNLWSNFKEIIIATVLFIIISLPITDSLIGKFVKVDDPNYRLIARAALFALILFLIQNFHLRK